MVILFHLTFLERVFHIKCELSTVLGGVIHSFILFFPFYLFIFHKLVFALRIFSTEFREVFHRNLPEPAFFSTVTISFIPPKNIFLHNLSTYLTVIFHIFIHRVAWFIHRFGRVIHTPNVRQANLIEDECKLGFCSVTLSWNPAS